MTNRSSYQQKKLILILLLVIILVLLGLIVLSAWNIYSAVDAYSVGNEIYTGIAQSYLSNVPENSGAAQTSAPSAQNGLILNVKPLETQGATGQNADASGAEETSAPGWITTQKPNVDFAAMKADNADSAAWLYSPNTIISYPVVHGQDNEYYLTHLFDGTKNVLGTLFVDARNTPGFVDQNTLIYGHNMKNGSMFATLHNYATQSYYDLHPFYYLYTETATYRVDIFSAYLTTTSDAVFCTDYGTEEDFAQFLSGAQAHSAVTTNVSVSGQDRIVTLVTCHSSSDDARYVVLGKLVLDES